MKPRILFIVGPTAVGKSFLATEVAKQIQGEIISADSMQVYRGMDIGTAKLSSKERQNIPHHLIDILKPSQDFSAYEFRTLALLAIGEILKRDKVPIIVGGTGLYVRTLLKGFSSLPGADEEMRKQMKEMAQVQGLAFLYERLTRLDPKRAKQISPSDERRIIRALEILETSGKKPSLIYTSNPSLTALGYQPVVIGVKIPRDELYRRINQRVENMVAQGLFEEASKLWAQKRSKSSSQAVGYKEIYASFENSALGRESVISSIQQRSRNLAKRQMTWFRKEEGIQWLDLNQEQDSEKTVKKMIEYWTSS